MVYAEILCKRFGKLRFIDKFGVFFLPTRPEPLNTLRPNVHFDAPACCSHGSIRSRSASLARRQLRLAAQRCRAKFDELLRRRQLYDAELCLAGIFDPWNCEPGMLYIYIERELFLLSNPRDLMIVLWK